jgi:hypothetical protein
VGSSAARVVVVVLTVLAAAGSVTGRVGAQQALYTAAATEPCLRSLPNALVGLPPSRPRTPTIWIHRERTHLYGRAVGALYAFKGAKGRWQGISLSFFKTERGARTFSKVISYERPILVRNVVVLSESPFEIPRTPWQKAVRACLRGGAPASTPQPRPVPKADLPAFVGYWGGHTRGLRISADGKASEYANSGCCIRSYDLSFQILRVTGTLTRATATYRVTRFKRNRTFDRPVMRIGEIGELQLRNGVITNRQSDDYFCSDPAWGATGVCGA